MDKLQIDIELIRKYFNGELSPAEMHLLEAEALENPLLQDALDGFEEFGVVPDDINELNKRLEKKLAEKNKGILMLWGLKQWGIAASIVFCIALVSIYLNQTPEDKTIALNELQKKEDIPKAEKKKIEIEEEESSQMETLEESVNNQNPIALKAQPQDNLTNPYQPEKDVVVQPMSSQIDETSKASEIGNEVIAKNQEKLNMARAAASLKAETFMVAKAKKEQESSIYKIKGKVTDQTNGTALPGVTIKNNSNGEIKHTDMNGAFTMDTGNPANLTISYLGYDSETTTAKLNDSLDIKLKPTQSALSEVVVVGYGSQKRANTIVGPQKGWTTFKKYLDTEAKKVKLGTGKVEVQFIIQANGTLTDFKVIKSSLKEANETAISLIKNYNDSWNGSADNVPQKAQVVIKFK